MLELTQEEKVILNSELVTTGDKKISYHLKNKLSLISSEEEDRLMRVNIITKKTKSS